MYPPQDGINDNEVNQVAQDEERDQQEAKEPRADSCSLEIPKHTAPTNWSSEVETYENRRKTITYKSPGYKSEQVPYLSVTQGASISVSTLCKSEDASTLDKHVSSQKRNIGLQCCSQKEKYMEVDGVRAVQYYWIYEGPAILRTVLYEGDNIFIINMRFVQQLGGLSEENYIPTLKNQSAEFMPYYEALLDSLVIPMNS